MNSFEQFGYRESWSATEKKVARKAFDQALDRNLAAIIAEARRTMAKVREPSDLWKLEAYLTESRTKIDRVYRFRYSDLLNVFSILMRDGWLHEEDLVGLQPDKIAAIKRGSEVFR